MFVPPTDVKFQDLGQMMKDLGGNKGIPSVSVPTIPSGENSTGNY